MRVWRDRWARFLAWPGNPWYLARFAGDAGMARLHRIAARHLFVRRFGRWAWLPKLILTLAWPARLIVQARRTLRQFGNQVRERHGRSRLRQGLDLAALGLGYGLPPLAYYRYRLFLPENRVRLAAYLYDHEIQGLFPYLNGYRTDPAVDDKRLFAERCTNAGLACVPTLAWGDGEVVRWVRDAWPRGDLIAKPAVGCRGEGIMLWRAHESGTYCADEAVPSGRHELLLRLIQSGVGRAWLLQPALANHAAIADLSPGPLVTVRLVTARTRDGYAEAFAAVLKMPVGGQIVNNHGIGSAIDLESGRISGAAYSYRPLHAGFELHPTTGARIVGRLLPDWGGVKRLALSAHALFPDDRLLGWDIALTPAGPLLLETNSGWDVAMPQIALRQPLGETAFSRLCELTLDDFGDVKGNT